MSDIVERLRKYSSRCPDGYGLNEAADEIERLRAEIRQLMFGAHALTNTDPFDEIEELKAENERLRTDLERAATIAHCEREHEG